MEKHKRNTEHTNVPQEGDDYTLSHDTSVEVPQQGIEEAVTVTPDEVINSELYPTWQRLK